MEMEAEQFVGGMAGGMGMGGRQLNLKEILQYISTGNQTLDIVICGTVVVIVMIVADPSSGLHPTALVDRIYRHIKERWFSAEPMGSLELSVELQTRQSHQTFTPTYRAVMHKMAQITDGRVWKLREHNNGTTYDHALKTEVDDAMFRVVQEDPIEVEPDVWVRAEQLKEDRPNPRNQGSIRVELHKVVVYSYVYTASFIKDRVHEWLEEFKGHKKTQIRDRQLIFMVRFVGDDKPPEIQYCNFHSFRTFDNLFFEQKDEVLEDIDFFLNEKEWHAERGLPDTFGVLGFGEPGCGKTSFIKALLHKTKRHGIVFSINHNTNLEAIEQLMRSDTICDFPIPQNQRVYVLEDIDAMGDVVNRRTNEEEKGKEGSAEAKLMRAIKEGFSRTSENHLGFLLNLLDGIVESPGRMMVMTTNFVEKLDPALIRPGRIDLKVEFKRCSLAILCRILSHFYDNTVQLSDLPSEVSEYLFSPAEVSQLCRAHKHDYESMMHALRRSAQHKRRNEGNSAAVSIWETCEREEIFDEKSAVTFQSVPQLAVGGS